jgi:uncharacterized membrane protein (UPF0182 family)
MMYNDKIGYGPTVGDALTGLFGPGAAAAATGIVPTDAGAPQTPPASPPAPANVPPGSPLPTAIPPGPDGSVTLSPAKAAALQEIQAALGAAKDAQKKGDFAGYGAALQHLDDAITKYNNAK